VKTFAFAVYALFSGFIAENAVSFYFIIYEDNYDKLVFGFSVIFE